MNDTLYAYLAGAMDSDGFFGIRRQTYHIRVRGDATQPVYSERCGLKQVTPDIPQLLKEIFGGRFDKQRPSTMNGKEIYGWDASDKIAANAAKTLLPFLRIKRARAELLLELRHTKDNPRYQQSAYWFAQEHPDWQQMEMVTYSQAMQMIGYTNAGSVSQAVANGTLLALPRVGVGVESARIPKPLVELTIIESARSKDGRKRCRPRQLIEWRERLWEACRQLNRIGTGQHPITERTGRYTVK